MTNGRFATLILVIIAALLIGKGVERYQACQEKGGDYCKIGSMRGPFWRPTLIR